ncbi:PEPxxWA-CTERM sorting domain-containing protein [Phenylobacterium sp.]|uniref:PEPxxWA-CTERM sorting domain-containing protein n=1 Tax=Phenylobacterium sp. TaxID=1871053 RepID=UPI003566B23E
MKSMLKVLAAAAVLAFASSAHATVVTLDFDGINTSGPSDAVQILNFYAGGFSGDRTAPGPNFGVTFTPNAIAGCELGQPCSRGDFLASGSPSGPNVMGFNIGGPAIMNVAGGFADLSLSYASELAASVEIWSGLDGGGDLLATIGLLAEPNGSGQPGCERQAILCPFRSARSDFAGVAHSLKFVGVVQSTAFDDITIDANLPTAGVPEPASWALMIGGFALTGAALRRRRAAVYAA